MSEKDPNGLNPHEAGAKLDEGKIMGGVLDDFALALLAVAEVGTFGAQKYTRGGWQSVPNGQERYRDALWRHHLKERHETHDQDSGLLHKAHKAWNALAELDLYLREQRAADEQRQETFAPLEELPPAPEPYVSPGAQVPQDLGHIFGCNDCQCIWERPVPLAECEGCGRKVAGSRITVDSFKDKEPDLGAPTYELSAEEENDFNNGMLGAPMPEEPTPETHAEYVHKCEHEDCRRKYFTADSEFADCPNCGRRTRGGWEG